MAKSRSTRKSRTAVPRPTSVRRAREPWWVEFEDEQLLDLRLSDLGLKIEGTEIEPRIQRLYDELDFRGIPFRPHCWLSNEWFSPDRSPGIAIPFYLAHPRLKQLERRQMLEVEGGTERSFMRIMRHEAGHAIDTAYQLHRRRTWRDLFGLFSEPYPRFYQPRPYSRSFVLHLDMWYAQAHPAEDFAETFAVWLRRGSQWRKRYKGWPAMKKLRYVDELMKHLADRKPVIRTREQVDPLRQITTTLREHYRKKRAYYSREFPEFYDRDLRRLFSDQKKDRDRPTAASFLRSVRPEIRRQIARWTGESQYTIDHVLRDMTSRAMQLKLRLARPPAQAKVELLVLVTVQTMNYLHGGHHRVAL
jgi:hypothetical protein